MQFVILLFNHNYYNFFKIFTLTIYKVKFIIFLLIKSVKLSVYTN